MGALPLLAAVAARLLRVGGAGEDAPDCGPREAPCATLRHAILERAVNGDEVVLLSGVLRGEGNRMIEWPDDLQDITIRSDSGDPESSVVDLEFLGLLIAFDFDPPVTFKNFTVCKGAFEDPVSGSSAGGVFRIVGSSPVFKHMVFRDNLLQGSGSKGSVAYISDGSPKFTDCIFENNFAGIAGTLYIEGTNATAPHFLRSSFLNSGCKVGGYGGVVVPEGYSRSIFEDCYFANCSGTYGACIDDGEKAHTLFIRSIFKGGRALRGGIYYGFGQALTEFHECVFEQSHAENNGGVAFTSTSVTSIFRKCTFRDSSAGAEAGFLVAKDDSTVLLINSTMLNGYANVAGCMRASSMVPVTIEGGTYSCRAVEGGGIFHVYAGEIRATDVVFLRGSAKLGGAVSVAPRGKVICTRCHFEGNLAEDGGAIGTDFGDLEVHLISCTCIRNEAQRNGGCLHSVSPSGIVSITNSFIDRNRALNGAGIYVDVSSFGGAVHTFMHSSISYNIGHKIGIGKYFQAAISGAGLYVKDAVSTVQPPSCPFVHRLALIELKFEGNTASIGAGIYWSINGDQKCSLAQICHGCNFDSNFASDYGDDAAGSVATIVLDGEMPTPYPGETFEIRVIGIDMFGSQLRGDHEPVRVLLDQVEDLASPTMWPVGEFMSDGFARLRGLTLYGDEGSPYTLVLSSNPPVSIAGSNVLAGRLESCRPGTHFNLEYGCREPREIIRYQVTSNIIAATAHKAGSSATPPDVIRNLTLVMNGNEDTRTTVTVDGSAANESLPSWLQAVQKLIVIDPETADASLGFRFVPDGLSAGTYMSTVHLTAVTMGIETVYLVPAQFVVTASPTASMSIWGRPTRLISSAGALICIGNENESVPLYLDVQVPSKRLYFTACDRDGFPVPNAQQFGAAFEAQLESNRDPDLRPHTDIVFTGTDGIFMLQVEPPVPGRWTLSLNMLESDAINTSQIGARRIIILECSANQILMDDGIRCSCAPHYEPRGLTGQCTACSGMTAKDFAGDFPCQFPVWAMIVLCSVGAALLLILCALQDLNRRRKEKRNRAALLRVGIERARVVVNGRKSPFPVLKLNTGERWHLFLSHVWFSSQDKVTVIKQQTARLVPGLKVFQDIEDLDDLTMLEAYVEASSSVLIFCSSGYFESKNCLREARKAADLMKPLILVHDADLTKGGVSYDSFVQQSPADLVPYIFDDCFPLIPWHSMPHLRMVMCRLIIEHVLLNTPAYFGQRELDLYSYDALDAFLWRLPEHIILNYSTANKGALMAIEMLRATVENPENILHKEIAGGGNEKGVTGPTSRLTEWMRKQQQVIPFHDKKYFLLYLCKDVFEGKDGEKLHADVRTAQTNGCKIVILHERRPEYDGCEFSHFLATGPRELINSGIFQQIAVPIFGCDFQTASAIQAVQAIGAKPYRLRRRCSRLTSRNVSTTTPDVSFTSRCSPRGSTDSISNRVGLRKGTKSSLTACHGCTLHQSSFFHSGNHIIQVGCLCSGDAERSPSPILSPARHNRQVNGDRLFHNPLAQSSLAI